MASSSRVAVIIGVGPGLGSAVAKRFAKEGYTVALVARNETKVSDLKVEIEKSGGKAIAVGADTTVESDVKSAFQKIKASAGPAEVLVYNAGAFSRGNVADVSAADFEKAWKGNCLGGFLAAKEALPDMLAAKRGTIIFTGATASMRGSAGFSCLAVGKFGLRALSQSIAREYGPQGIHCTHVIIDGVINTPVTKAWGKPEAEMLNPDDIAAQYWHIHNQPRTTWTQELDLRPNTEKF